MPTRKVNLTPELDHFVASKVKAGLYGNASEVMQAALRSLERDEREREQKMARSERLSTKALRVGWPSLESLRGFVGGMGVLRGKLNGAHTWIPGRLSRMHSWRVLRICLRRWPACSMH